jgi:hypothetical protein
MATASTNITIKDTTPPQAHANLVPLDRWDEKGGLFKVEVSCQDKCSAHTSSRADINGITVTDDQLV